jgi:signal peptidase I
VSETGHAAALPAARTALPARRPARARLRPRHAALGMGYLLVGLVAGLVLALVGPRILGYHTLTVLSGSMEPAIHTGDAVITETIPPLDARVGDVVTFRDPSGAGRLITHRVRSVHVQSGQVNVTTKGDANNTPETWTVPEAGTIGRVVYRVPRAGRVLMWSGSPFGRLGLFVIPVLLLGLLEIVRIWRMPGEDPE